MIDNSKIILTEGGNANIGGISADRLDLNKVSRKEVVKVIDRALQAINVAFNKLYKTPLWSPELIQSKEFLSGSALHLFDKNIPDDQFTQAKPSVGDIDTMIDKKLAEKVDEFLTNITGKKIGPARLVGYKSNRAQDTLISLWEFQKPPVKVQIDMELVDYKRGAPSEWSKFSHSSSWEDLSAGIKGVFHKYLLRAITHKDSRERYVQLKTKLKKVTSADLAFAVSGGIRQKFEPVIDPETKEQAVASDGIPIYKKLQPSESEYVTKIKDMFTLLIGHKPVKGEEKALGSFVGLLGLINSNFTPSEKRKIAGKFLELIFGPIAQQLYKNDPELDKKEKEIALNTLVQVLQIEVDRVGIDKIISDYYGTEVEVEEEEEITEEGGTVINKDDLRKLEFYANNFFHTLGIDVNFGYHFFDRVNDPRNRKQITLDELSKLFQDEYRKWGKKIAQLGPDSEAVLKDMSSDINVPFVLTWDRHNQELTLKAKTVMRKKNFHTPDPVFAVEEIEEPDDLNVHFHDMLNPELFDHNKHMDPTVRQKLLSIAEDFKKTLGIPIPNLDDITVSGSNASFTYTPKSDIDLHLVVDLPQADEDPAYRELFDAKKFQYNEQHAFKIKGYDVELYVQNAKEEHISQGIYSIKNDAWVKEPQPVEATFDEESTRCKYDTIKHLILKAIKAQDYFLATKLRDTIKKYRRIGLHSTGEFGPENLAFKALRANGYIEKLYTLLNDLKDKEFSLESHEQRLTEIDMSPGSFTQFASTPAAQNTKVGFEFEMIMPDLTVQYQWDDDFNYDEPVEDNEFNIDVSAFNQVAYQIRDAVKMQLMASSEYHAFRNRQEDVWYLETDESIEAKEREGEAGLELISPPMPLNKATEKLDAVFTWMNASGARTDSSTGFHMGVSIPNMSDIDYTKLILFLGDKHILSEFGRITNSYTESSLARLERNASHNIVPVFNALRAGLNKASMKLIENLLVPRGEKYVSVNIKGNYIEFRAAGGNYLNQVEKIKNTMLRYVRVINLAADPEEAKEEYAKKLYKVLLSAGQDDEYNSMKWFAMYASGSLPQEELKMRLNRILYKRAIDNLKKNYGLPVWNAYDKDGNVRFKITGQNAMDAMERAKQFDGNIEIVHVEPYRADMPKESLTELANQPYPFHFEDDDGYGMLEARFKTESGMPYKVVIIKDEDENGEDKISVEFSALVQNDDDGFKYSQKVINTGNAFRVFATVAIILKKYLQANPDVSAFDFSADDKEPSRVKLYDTMAKSLPRFIPGFKFSHIDQGFSYKHYQFHKVIARPKKLGEYIMNSQRPFEWTK